MARALRSTLLRAAIVGLALAASTPVLAGEPSPAEIAALRQLFNEGKELEKQKSWAEALEKFKKVGEVKMTPQVRFHIALCEEHLGHLVTALNGFELALDEAKRAGTAAPDVVENAPSRIDDLRKRVPTLKLVSDDSLAGAKVLLDGAPVAAALVGTDLPVDPGKHVVEVENNGKTVFHKELTLAERSAQKVELTVDEEAPPVAVAPPTGVPTEPPKEQPRPPPGAKPGESSGPGRWPAVAVAGAGVLSFAGAGIFFVLRQQTIDDVRESCSAKTPDAKCDPALRSTADRGETYTVAGDILLGVGAAAIVTAGVLWFVLAPSNPTPASQTSLRVAPTATGVRVLGTF